MTESFDPVLCRQLGEVTSALSEVASATELRAEIADALGLPGVARSDLYRLFIKDLPPFASIYLSADGNIGGDSQAVISGIYRALGVPVPNDPDHLSSLFALLSQILVAEAKSIENGSEPELSSVVRTRQVLVNDHLLTWLPAYLISAIRVAPQPLSNWVSLCWDALRLLSPPAEAPGPKDREVCLDQVDNLAKLIDFLTTPSKSGIILTLSDIETISTEIGLAVRAGTKRMVLKDVFLTEPEGFSEKVEALIRRQISDYISATAEFSYLDAWVVNAENALKILSNCQ
jgi:TorA maturation chaperone TorD